MTETVAGIERSAPAGHVDGATRQYLMCGLVAGPLYLAVGLAQAVLRQGFSLARHPLSVLANGSTGWVQTLNFVVTGLLVIVSAVGFRRALESPARAMSWFLGAFGVSMVAAAAFRADPMDGFPVGTPLGPPTTISTTGMLHFVAGGLGFVSLAISCLLAARVLSRRGERPLARLSLAAGVVVLVGFFGGAAIPGSSPVLGIWIAVVAGWAWHVLLSHRCRAG